MARQSAVLKGQIADTLSFLRQQLTALLEHDFDIEKSLRNIEGLDTSSAQAL